MLGEGSRKLVAFIITLVCLAVVAFAADADTRQLVVEQVKWLFGAFAGANGLEHLGRGIANRSTEAPDADAA